MFPTHHPTGRVVGPTPGRLAKLELRPVEATRAGGGGQPLSNCSAPPATGTIAAGFTAEDDGGGGGGGWPAGSTSTEVEDDGRAAALKRGLTVVEGAEDGGASACGVLWQAGGVGGFDMVAARKPETRKTEPNSRIERAFLRRDYCRYRRSAWRPSGTTLKGIEL